ncbi:MAG: hypothetical protein SOZ80_04890 [Prevotella sp.]|uniref:hypothetical protein n=1 Tax=Prevotella sp. TaxID=59823 RepID=UPI002A7EC74A|nr:hypothetical protein [Prevotella sp.]MDY4020096.1 hypothetical protein [Prevotella sp.]
MSTMNHEELVELLQQGRIGHLRFVLESEDAEDFLEWCRTHGTDPSDESAEFYIEQTDIDHMDRQVIDDEDYGIWN